MKILFVASYNKGRYAPFITEQVDALRQAGYEVDIFGVIGKGITGYLKALPKLKGKISEFHPDVVHVHFGLSGLLANLQRTIPVITTYHGSDINLPKNRPFSKLAMWLSAWNIFVSKRNMALVGAVEGKKCSLIPCGINLPKSWKELQNQKIEQLTLNQWVGMEFSKGKKHVLFAGAFDNAIKDPILAKATIGELNDKGLNVELIELKGYNRDQVNALMYSCDAFLMTSKSEGSPQVVKEAMACGCPIVSVDVGDVAERVEGVEGCFVVRSREPRKIADALEKAIAFDGRTKGRERIIESELTNKQVVAHIVKIYEKVLRQ